MFHTRVLLLSGCTIILMASVPAYADSGEAGVTDILVTAQPEQALTLPTSTGSRLGLTSLETPASVATLNGDEIRARGDLNIIDAVTRTPGITTSANPGNGGTALAARGFNGQGSVLQLYDGVRLFPVAGTITFPVDPWNVERIEVLSGPASVLYGQGALGGAVNVITRKPNSERTEIEGEASYGSQDSWHAAAGAGGPIGQLLSYRVDASYRLSDGYVDRGQSKSLALSGALRFTPSNDFSLTLRNDYGNQRPTEYFGTPLLDGRLDTGIRRRNYNVADASLHYRDNRTIAALDLSHHASARQRGVAAGGHVGVRALCHRCYRRTVDRYLARSGGREAVSRSPYDPISGLDEMASCDRLHGRPVPHHVDLQRLAIG